jgi:hypothetical protein
MRPMRPKPLIPTCEEMSVAVTSCSGVGEAHLDDHDELDCCAERKSVVMSEELIERRRAHCL